MSRRKKARAPYAPKGLPTKLDLDYGADFLETAGPYIPATWTVPKSIENQLRSSGRPVPAPVLGHLLLDTGADTTCISQLAAQQLGLQAVRRVNTYGVGGLHQNDVVVAQLHISIGNPRKEVNTISWNLQCQAVPELDQHAHRHGIKVNDQPVNMMGLIGRDILRRATVTYSGKTGKLQIAFDRQWVKSLGPSP